MTDKKDEALKLALEALESCSAGDYSTGHVIHPSFDVDAVNRAIEAIDALAEQPAQQQEPVAWLSRDDARLALWDAINKREFGNPTDDKLILDHLRKNGLWIGKYTSPPASKPWVGLTDVEWMNIVNKDHAWFGQRPEDVAHEVAKLVEAKLKEKNT